MTAQHLPFSDADLTAYLDGEASTSQAAEIKAALESNALLAARLNALEIDKAALRAAFDPSALGAPVLPESQLKTPSARALPLAAPLALAASFAAGLLVMTALRPTPDWIDAVASYQALYVEETLSGRTQPMPITQDVLARAEESLGVDLDAALELDGLTLKRAQILGFNGTLLLQMAYVDDQGRPFAFCVTRTDERDRGLQTGESHALAKASWVEDGVGFLLIGGDETGFVEQISTDLAPRL